MTSDGNPIDIEVGIINLNPIICSPFIQLMITSHVSAEWSSLLLQTSWGLSGKQVWVGEGILEELWGSPSYSLFRGRKWRLPYLSSKDQLR